MNCFSCGSEVQSGFAFCPKCGTKQPNACPACGYLCAPDFVYCPKCGALVTEAPKSGGQASVRPSGATIPLRASSPPLVPTAEARQEFRPQPDKIDSEANRRTITVLFADLSGFTAMSERLDPEVMQTLQNELFEELTAAVQGFGGFVDKFIGDALLALFGAPAAHEDDPERAVRSALDMMSRTARLSERVKAYAGSPLLLHVGINTGHVVAGGLGVGVAKSYSVTGDTVNTAQRLQSMASPGEVLVGPLTHRLTRHAFSYDSLGEVSLKGKCKGGLYVDTWKAYYPNGEKAWQVDFVAGRPDGTFKAWYDTGKDQVKVSYDKGLLKGKYKAWHPNGKLAAEGEYKDGKKAGCWETYFDTGEHESKGAYDTGEQRGTWLFWDAQQTKRKESYGGEPSQGKCVILL